MDLQAITSGADLTRRYLRTGLVVGALVNLFGLLDRGAPDLVTFARGIMMVFCCASLLLLRRGWSARALGQAVTLFFPFMVLGVGILRADSEWTVSFSYLPATLALGILLGGKRLASLVAAAVVVVMAGAYLLAGLPRPAYFGIHFTNLVLAMAILHAFVYGLARVLGTGATELSNSTRALEAARETNQGLAKALSTRVLNAVDQLDSDLREDHPAIGHSAAELNRVLQECRAQVPPAPILADQTLGDRLAALHRSLMNWTVIFVFVLSIVLTVRNAISGHPLALSFQAAIAVSAGIIVTLRRARPRWQTPLHLVLVLIQFGYGVFMLTIWFAIAPMPPPNFPLLFAASVVLAVTLRPLMAWLVLAAMVLISLAMLANHPGIPWTAPITLALSYGMLGWSVYHWPRQLLDRLMRERDEALAKIRERRRLVATLFHDLANPLAVVIILADDLMHAKADARDMADARSMVRRMRATLSSAISGQIVSTVTEAGRLGTDLERLFRERLTKKRLALHVSGDLSARLRCDETLLRDSVLANLLSNAIKFSPADSAIDLSVRAGTKTILLVLEDRGPGLSPEVMAALGSGVPAPSQPGTEGELGSGYGLLLAKDYLTSMGGRLTVSPREGGGLRVLLSLPAA